jgi:hypothetical protein
MILKALILIKYDTEPNDYPDPDPRKMLKLDIEQDPAATILESDWTIVSAELINE